MAPTYKQQHELRKAIAEYWINPELRSGETTNSGKREASLSCLFDSSNYSCSVSGVTNLFLSPAAPSLPTSDTTVENKSVLGFMMHHWMRG